MTEIINIETYTVIGIVMFLSGLFTVVTRKNIIGILMGLELILNSAALNFASFGRFTNSGIEGQIFSIFIIIIAAAEAAIALALLLSVYGRYRDINADKLDILKG